MADLFGEYDLASSSGISGNLGDLGGVNLGGLPGAGPGNRRSRSGRQRLATERMLRGQPPQPQPPQPQLPRPMQASAAQSRGGWMGGAAMPQSGPGYDMIADHRKQYEQGIKSTNDAIEREMNSRVEQAREQRQQEHEQRLAEMDYRAELARLNAPIMMQQQQLNSRNARNSALWRAAGFGGTADPFAPIRASLLG